MIRPITAMSGGVLGLLLGAVGAPALGGVTPEPSPERSSVIWRAVDYQEHTSGSQTPDEPARDKADLSEDYLSYGGFGCVVQDDGTDQCFGQPAVPVPAAEEDDPELTLGQILTAVRQIGLPSLKINIQPGDETLVNLDTIFYAQPQPFNRGITLLDYDIDLRATPASYRWHHGDGTSHTTTKPGAAYPSKAVTHRYQKKAKNLTPSVDVTYTVRFRVDGGAWQDLGQTLTATGPTGELDVKEATAVLTKF